MADGWTRIARTTTRALERITGRGGTAISRCGNQPGVMSLGGEVQAGYGCGSRRAAQLRAWFSRAQFALARCRREALAKSRKTRPCGSQGSRTESSRGAGRIGTQYSGVRSAARFQQAASGSAPPIRVTKPLADIVATCIEGRGVDRITRAPGTHSAERRAAASRPGDEARESGDKCHAE